MQQFVFNDIVIITRQFNNDTYFRCNDVVTALGYKSLERKPYSNLYHPNTLQRFDKIGNDVSDKPHTKYMQKNGVFELAFKCKLESAKAFQQMLMRYIDGIVNTTLESQALSYKSQLALTEKSHAELIAQYEKRIAEKDQEIKENDEEIDEKDEELEQKDEELERKDELLEEKDVEIDEMDQALEAKKIDACDERDREIRENNKSTN
jgi:prophage antirepressor-like protein